MTIKQLFIIVGILILGQVAFAAPEAAQSSVEVLWEVTTPDPTDPKQADDVPMLKATVIGAPNQPMEKFILVDKSAKPPIELKASKVTPFLKSNEKVAVAIVMLGWEPWIGNDKEVPELPEGDSSRMTGVLMDLRTSLDRLKFQESGPPGSLGMVITYADSPKIRVPMGPLGEINGSKLGSQRDYFGSTGNEMVSGIRLAMAELKKVQVSRKVLIVVCDGNDTNNDAAKPQLLDLKKQAQQDGVQTFAIVYRAPLSGSANIIPTMIAQTAVVTTAENIASAIANILARMDDRKYFEFKGYDKAKDIGLSFDGKIHQLAIKVDNQETEPVDVLLKPYERVTGSGFPWITLIIILLVLFLLIFIMVKIFKKKPAEAPLPAPIMEMPTEAPKPLGPMKTVMIGQGGDEGGFPVVGWLVPLNGQHAYQTFRLRSSMTKVGTAPPCDIIVNDGFMSTEHCQINCSPQGFTLIDGGSTNGSYVNERRVTAKHDLVDNDLVTFGKTNFKFKSIV